MIVLYGLVCLLEELTHAKKKKIKIKIKNEKKKKKKKNWPLYYSVMPLFIPDNLLL